MPTISAYEPINERRPINVVAGKACRWGTTLLSLQQAS